MSNYMASQDARLSKFEADLKQQQSEMTNKIDTVLKAITDRITGALPSDTVKNLKLNVNPMIPVLSAMVPTTLTIEIPEQAFVEYAFLRTDEAGDARLSKFEADLKQQQSEMTNKIDTVLKAITDRITGALPSDTVKNLKLNVNPMILVLSARSYPIETPQCSTRIHSSINAITVIFDEKKLGSS
nr:ribonuclease H-like domain-containing protein [Tanacetum cinerariifolium]